MSKYHGCQYAHPPKFKKDTSLESCWYEHAVQLPTFSCRLKPTGDYFAIKKICTYKGWLHKCFYLVKEPSMQQMDLEASQVGN
jgi:hypothetical protein